MDICKKCEKRTECTKRRKLECRRCEPLALCDNCAKKDTWQCTTCGWPTKTVTSKCAQTPLVNSDCEDESDTVWTRGLQLCNHRLDVCHECTRKLVRCQDKKCNYAWRQVKQEDRD